MRWIALCRRSAVLLACAGMLLPLERVSAQTGDSPAASAQQQKVELPVVDVTLQNGRTLVGQVLGPQGSPAGGIQVDVLGGNQRIATVQTDAQGCFRVDLARGGIYQIQTSIGICVVRAWNPQAAPPVAKPNLLIVPNVVRGQENPMAAFFYNPWVIVGVAAVAIAVPVALYNNKSDDPPQS